MNATLGIIVSLSIVLVFCLSSWLTAKPNSVKENFEAKKHHNLSQYRGYEFFLKITIAILTGIGLVYYKFSLPDSDPSVLVRLTKTGVMMVKALGRLELLASTYTLIAIASHHREKIRMRKERALKRLFWGQLPYMMATIFIVAASIFWFTESETITN